MWEQSSEEWWIVNTDRQTDCTRDTRHSDTCLHQKPLQLGAGEETRARQWDGDLLSPGHSVAAQDNFVR